MYRVYVHDKASGSTSGAAILGYVQQPFGCFPCDPYISVFWKKSDADNFKKLIEDWYKQDGSYDNYVVTVSKKTTKDLRGGK